MKKLLVVLFVVLLTPALMFAGGTKEPAPTQASATSAEQAKTGGIDFESRWRDPQMPASWFKAPATASQMGIKSFKQSPMLDARVSSGKLPPVAKRLPTNPPVVEPYQKVGKYGGTLTIYAVNLERSEFTYYTGGEHQEGVNVPTPDGQGYVPWFAEDIQFLEDDTVIQIRFRDGLRWSDGTPFLAGDEYEFYWNSTLNKTRFDPSLLVNSLEDMVKIDKNTVQLRFGSPVPTYNYDLKHSWVGDVLEANMPLAPMHIMKQNLPEIVGEQKALAKARELGFDSVESYLTELTQQVRKQSDPRFGMPTMQAYVIVSKTATEIGRASWGGRVLLSVVAG